MRSSRLLEMLLVLQTRGAVTAAELASRLEVSPRTIYRDAEALGAAGVPIYAERGRGGGIRLLPGFRTDVTGLTEDEARALFVLTTGGAHADLGLAGPLRSAVAKVLRAVPAPFQPAAAAASERILVDPVGWLRSADSVGELGTLQSAVFADRRIRLRYRSSGQQEATERVVDPYGLVCKSGVWYLVADSAGAGRLFRVSRVAAAFVCDEPVIRRDGVSLAALWEQLRRQVDERPTPVLVQVLVRRSVLDLFSRICAANLAGPAGDAGLAGGRPVSCLIGGGTADGEDGSGGVGGTGMGSGGTTDGEVGGTAMGSDGTAGRRQAAHNGTVAGGGRGSRDDEADDGAGNGRATDNGMAGGRPVARDGQVADGGRRAGAGEWIAVPLRFAAVKATRTLLSFGDDVVVLSPAEVRDELAAVASAVVAGYAADAAATS